MSEGVNRVTLLGNIGSDPELRFTNGGQGVLNMRLATTERYKDKDDEWKERTEWHNVVLWGKRAEAMDKILAKGSQIMVEGGLRTSEYEKDGVKRYKTEIHATGVFLCGKAPERDRDDRGDTREPAQSRGRDDRGRDDDRGRGRDRDDRRDPPPRDDRRDSRRDDRRPAQGGAADDLPF